VTPLLTAFLAVHARVGLRRTSPPRPRIPSSLPGL